MNVSFEWLTEYIGKDTELTAAKVVELLGAHAFEIEEVVEKGDDTVIDVDVLPNRSSDCLCHRGVARELASITGVALANDPLATVPALTLTDVIDVQIEAREACPRFTASLIAGIEVKDSPDWLKARLEAIGQRSINNIVDATNYVMFALGQPIHAYDAELFPQVDGKWQFGVRYATEGEEVSLIAEGGKDEDRIITCKGTELLIIDRSSDTPIGLAGVKGGRFAGVHTGTTKVIIEAAHFDPIITRKTARRLGIVIDASKRFENEPSRELPSYAQRDIIELIKDIAGGEYVGTVDAYLEKTAVISVEVSPARANALLGLSLPVTEMKTILERTGSTVKEKGDGLVVTGPFERTDLNIEEDFIEEIGRLHGYDHVESVVPDAVPLPELNKRHYYGEVVRQLLLAEGFSEVITSSFRNKDKVQLRNALASDKSCLRSHLHKNISEALDKNAGFTDLLGTANTRLFEIGTVFSKGEAGVEEHVSLAIGVRIKQSGYSQKEDGVLNAVLDVVSTALGVDMQWDTQQGIAEVNFSELLTKLADPVAYTPVTVSEEVVYKQFSVFPHMSRDIALWVSGSPGNCSKKEDVERVLTESAGPLHVRTTFLDEFTKDGRTSYAFRLVFQSPDRTLTDDEVNKVMQEVYAAVEKKEWEVR